MAKKTIVEALADRYVSLNRLAAGEYAITKLAAFDRPFTGRDGNEVPFQILAIFTDNTDEHFLELNQLWQRPRRAVKEDGSDATYPVRPTGTLFDKFLELVQDKSYKDAVDTFNASPLIGKKFRLEWVAYVPAGSTSGYAYVAHADLLP